VRRSASTTQDRKTHNYFLVYNTILFFLKEIWCYIVLVCFVVKLCHTYVYSMRLRMFFWANMRLRIVRHSLLFFSFLQISDDKKVSTLYIEILFYFILFLYQKKNFILFFSPLVMIRVVLSVCGVSTCTMLESWSLNITVLIIWRVKFLIRFFFFYMKFIILTDTIG